VQDLLNEGASREICRRTLKLLEEVVCKRGLTLDKELLCSLSEFVKATDDDRQAANLVADLTELKDDYYVEGEIRAALSVSDDNLHTARILRALDQDGELVESANVLGSRIKDRRLRRIVARMIVEEDKKSLLRLTSCTQVVAEMGSQVPGVPDMQASLEWLDQYPVALHQALGELSRVSGMLPGWLREFARQGLSEGGQAAGELDKLRQKLGP